MQEYSGDKSPHLVVILDLFWVLIEIIQQVLVYAKEYVRGNTTIFNDGPDHANQVRDNLHDGHN